MDLVGIYHADYGLYIIIWKNGNWKGRRKKEWKAKKQDNSKEVFLKWLDEEDPFGLNEEM